ncbi:MAG: DUF4342 domain-containing protein [Anaerolineae bacterium]|nr:DUF4342 domain-containing protein [Anaerolineae bacterium]
MSDQNPEDKKTFTEQVEVAGNQLVEQFKEIIEQGNVRRMIVKTQDGKTLVEIPLTVGAAIGGALALFNPWLAMLGALGALVARVTIEIVREQPDTVEGEIKQKVDDIADKLSE